jgi:hypothetical protein
MYTVFDSHTGIALATIVAESEDQARTEFSTRFTGFLGRRLFFIEGAASIVCAGGRVAHPHGGLSQNHESTVRRLANAAGIHCVVTR